MYHLPYDSSSTSWTSTAVCVAVLLSLVRAHILSLALCCADCPSTHSVRTLRCHRRRCSEPVRSGKTTNPSPMHNVSGCFTSRALCPMAGRQPRHSPQISNAKQRHHSDRTTSLQMVRSGNGCFIRQVSCPTIGRQPGSSPQVSNECQLEHGETTTYQMVQRGNGCSIRQVLCQTTGLQPCRQMCLLPMSTCARFGQCQE